MAGQADRDGRASVSPIDPALQPASGRVQRGVVGALHDLEPDPSPRDASACAERRSQPRLVERAGDARLELHAPRRSLRVEQRAGCALALAIHSQLSTQL